jgi:hypothetical protein
MVRDDDNGVSIAPELYLVPDEVWPRIRDSEPLGLYRGPVGLDDGRIVEGMLVDLTCVARHGVSRHGGWMTYIRSRPSPPSPVTL